MEYYNTPSTFEVVAKFKIVQLSDNLYIYGAWF